MRKQYMIEAYSQTVVEYGSKSVEVVEFLNNSPKWFLRRINLIHVLNVIVGIINHDREELVVTQTFDKLALPYLMGKSVKVLDVIERIHYSGILWATVIATVDYLRQEFPEDERLKTLWRMVKEPKLTIESPMPTGSDRESYLIFLKLLDTDLTKVLVTYFSREL